MKTLLILLFLALAGCAAQPVQPITGAASGGITAFATLAPFGSFEMELAPAYTRLAVLRHNAARQLTQGRITVGAAEDIQAMADAARSSLDAAHAETMDGKEKPTARKNLANAKLLIEDAEKLLGDRK